MAKMKACPVCGQKVGIEKLEAHVKKVHPREKVEIDFDDEEEKEVRDAKKAYKPGVRPQGKWIVLGAVIVVIVIVLAMVFIPRGLGPGDVPPDFTLRDTNSISWNLDAHKTGKPILLEFMHPDCGACKTMVSILYQFWQSYQADLEIITIAVTLQASGFRNPPTIQMIDELKQAYGPSPWTYLLDDSTNVRDLYGVVSTPTFYLIGGDGKIAIKHIGTWNYIQMEADISPFL